jgi:protein TonB
MTLKANPEERLVGAPRSRRAARARFIALLALAALLHAALIVLILYKTKNETAQLPPEQEIPVEVVELPPEPEPPPPPEQKKEQPKKPKIDPEELKPAFDAPRDENQETIEREAPDKETQSPREAPPTKQTAEQPAPKAPPAEVKETAPDPSPQHNPETLAEDKTEDKPDAEPLAEAEKKEPAKPKNRQTKRDPVKTPPAKGKQKSVAEQLAALSPAPSYSVGSAAKRAPVGGGTEKSTYLSILYGLIMRHWRDPPSSNIRSLDAEGIIVFYVDDRGNLTHQAVYRASGRPDLDAAASTAVRRAAPFPPPPRGMPRSIIFQYGTK